MSRPILILLLSVLVLTPTTGCKDEENNRIADLAAAQLASQAEQNRGVHELQHEVAEGTTRLIEADRQSREQLVELQGDLQDQRREVDRQRDLLEVERKRVATARNFDSLTAVALNNTGLLLACLLPLALAWLVLRGPGDSSDDAVIVEVLLDDLTSDRPGLFVDHLTSQPNKASERKRLDHHAISPDHDRNTHGEDPCPTS